MSDGGHERANTFKNALIMASGVFDSVIISSSLRSDGFGDALLRGFVDSMLGLKAVAVMPSVELKDWEAMVMPIRGSLLVIAVGDAECPRGAVCIRPSGAEQIRIAVQEAADYSEVVQLPYVIIIDEFSDWVTAVRMRRKRRAVFNKNWISGYRWLGPSFTALVERPEWGVRRLRSLGLDVSYTELEPRSNTARSRDPIDVVDFVLYCLYKVLYDPMAEVGVPIVVVGRDMVVNVSGRGNFNPRPTAFLPSSSSEVPDVAVSKPLVAVHEIIRVGYEYGPVIGIAREEDVDEALLAEVSSKAAVLVIGSSGSRSCDSIASAVKELGVARLGNIIPTENKAVINVEQCDVCGDCVRLGCNAIRMEGGYPTVIADSCIGCGLCAAACTRNAITVGKP